LTPVVIEPTVTVQESANQAREMSKLSSADLEFFETSLIHIVQHGPTPDDSSTGIVDDSMVPSHPVGDSSQEAHQALDSSGYFHTTNGGLSDDSVVPSHSVGDSS